jgi:transcriptional regulator with XRE-family HTH domain
LEHKYGRPPLTEARRLIREKGWTYSEAARRLDRTPMYVRGVLLGKEMASRALVRDLALLLDVPEATLWPDVYEPVSG